MLKTDRSRTKMISRYSALILSLMTCGLVSVPVQAADLLQTYQDALQNDPVYAGARAALTAGQEKSVQGRALLMPTVNLTGTNTISNTYFTAGSVDINGGRTYYNNYTLQLTQPLFRWENWQQFEQGKLLVTASEAQFGQARLDLMIRVSQAYFDVLSAQDTLESVQANKTAITEQLAFAKRNFEVGTTTITDQHEAQARYDLAEIGRAHV